MARGAVIAGLVAFFLVASAQHFDQPRPRGSEIAAEQDGAHARGPTPPFGGPGPPPRRGCPRETLMRFSVFDAWLRELPLGWVLADLAAERLIGSCSPV